MHELLTDPFGSIYAVNCTLPEDGTLLCGALYIEPENPFTVIRLADNALILDVTLPPECVNNGSAITAWDVTLRCSTP
jgi:hypothetical protein